MISGNRFYYGVVESRADPLKLGRCKVRIIGVHTEDTTLLPTKDLPWAYPLQPIISAGVSGIGISPVGPVEGSWVVCIFRDEGSFQEPIMLGTIAGIPEEKEQKFSDPYSGTAGTRYEGLKDLTTIESDDSNSSEEEYVRDESGEIVRDGEGDPVKTSKNNVLKQSDRGFSNQKNEQGKTEYRIGEITGKSESGGRIDTINDYRGKAKNDPGGASYGKYQLASYMGADGPKSNRAKNSPVLRFIKNSKYKDDFAGLTPGTPAFDKKWKEVSARDPKGFEDAQRQYMVDSHYSPVVNDLRKDGIDLTNRGPAVQEMIFSTSTQYGSGKPIKRALKGKDLSKMTDAEIIAAVQDDKLKNLDRDFRSSSPNIRQGVANRIKREKTELTKIAGDDSPIAKEDLDAIEKKQKMLGKDNSNSNSNISLNVIPASGITDAITIDKNDKPGFQDPFGIYPRKKWINEQDVSRLARNEKIDETIMRAKENSLIKGVSTAGGGSWDEPKSPYNAKYPFNHVHQTESGHIIEYDDTPEAERIHIYHRAGAFIEFHPNGTVVYKSVKDQFEVTVGDRNIYVGGTCNITVKGDANIYAKGMLNMESDGDMTIKTGSNLYIGAEGQAYVISNGDMHVGSSGNLHEGARNIFMNCSWYPSGITAGDYAVGEISVEVFDDDEQQTTISYFEDAEIQRAKENGDIPPDAPAPIKSEDGTMISSTTKPDPEIDKLEKSEPDNKDVTCYGENQIKPSDPLSTHYKVADLTTSPVLTKVSLKAQEGLSECEIFNNLSALAKNVLEPLRSRYGNEFIITSALRQPKPGKKSQHSVGQAVDIQFPGLNRDEYVHRAQEISKILPGFDQIILEYHGRNPVIHISYNMDGNRGRKLSTPNLSTYFSGLRDRSMGLVYS